MRGLAALGSSLAVGVALGCTPSAAPPSASAEPSGSGAPASTAEPPPGPAEGSGTAGAPRVRVHEWGVVVVPHRGGPVAVRTFDRGEPPGLGPGPRPGAPTSPKVDPGAPAVRKPVLYVHLEGAVGPRRFDLAVEIPGGAVIESWPLAHPPGGATARWAGVVADPGACAPSPLPRPDEPACLGVPDGVCEASELAQVFTADGACLQHGGARFDHLFYRGVLPRSAIPVTATHAADGSVRLAGLDALGPTGSVLRVRQQPSSNVVSVGLLALDGGPEALAPAPSPDRVAEGLAWLADGPRAAGLTDDEIAAFVGAWEPEIFGAPGLADPARRDVVEVDRGVTDFVYFWLPAPAIDAAMPLAITPPPDEVRRVLLVALELPPDPRPDPRRR